MLSRLDARPAIRSWLARSRIPRPLLFAGLAAPLLILLWDIWTETQSPGMGLGLNPPDMIIRRLGEDGINILLLTLGVTSISRLAAIPQLIRFRRMIGLWAFAYLVLHLLASWALLLEFRFSALLGFIQKKPYVLAGMTSLVFLLPLALTSTRGWQRRLGRRWKTLHMLVYPAVIAGWIHVLWQVRASYSDAVLYGTIAAALLAERIVAAIRKRRRAAGT